MTYYVLVENKQKRSFKATIMGLPDCTADGSTRQEALQRVQQILATRLSQAEIVPIELDGEPAVNEHPWLKFAGMFRDDALFDEVLTEVEDYRREIDADPVTA